MVYSLPPAAKQTRKFPASHRVQHESSAKSDGFGKGTTDCRRGQQHGEGEMEREVLNEAVKEAKRFLRVANRMISIEDWEAHHGDIYASKYSAAVRRASMDLTRALADLRRPRR